MRKVLVPLGAILVLTFAGAGAALFIGTSLTSTEARHQQQRMIEASFSQSLNEHLRQLHSLSRWRPFEEHLADGNSDRWLDENIGQWLYAMFGHQLIMVLDAQNQIVKVRREGQTVSAAESDSLMGELLHSTLIQDPRRQDNADYARITQRAAALAVGNIQRDSDDLPRCRLVSLNFLDDGYLTSLAERNQLEGLHFSDGSSQSGTSARSRDLLIAQAGEPVGYLHWIPSRPGAQMLRTIGPSTGLAVLAISLLCLYRVRRLWNSSVTLSQSMLRLGASEAQAQHLAFHDVLTGLPNRALVEDRLTQALALATRNDRRVALLLIDLDRFKTINDTHGHHAGDLDCQSDFRHISIPGLGSAVVLKNVVLALMAHHESFSIGSFVFQPASGEIVERNRPTLQEEIYDVMPGLKNELCYHRRTELPKKAPQPLIPDCFQAYKVVTTGRACYVVLRYTR
nr:diguanylate cyclase [Pantoea vagans]